MFNLFSRVTKYGDNEPTHSVGVKIKMGPDVEINATFTGDNSYDLQCEVEDFVNCFTEDVVEEKQYGVCE